MNKTQTPFDLSGKTALLTGASGQLGTAFAHALSTAGCRMALADLESQKRACEALAKKLATDAKAYVLDVSDAASTEKAVAAAWKDFERIDVLVNNAGIAVFTPFEKRTPEEFHKVMAVNVEGTFHCTQSVVKRMQADGKGGSIVNIASVYGVKSADHRIYGNSGRNSSEVYAASKAAVIHLGRYLAAYLGKDGIRVNCISPGGVHNNQEPEFVRQYEHKTPLARMARPDDLTGALVYLASDASRYVTGHNLIVDGGFTAW